MAWQGQEGALGFRELASVVHEAVSAGSEILGLIKVDDIVVKEKKLHFAISFHSSIPLPLFNIQIRLVSLGDFFLLQAHIFNFSKLFIFSDH